MRPRICRNRDDRFSLTRATFFLWAIMSVTAFGMVSKGHANVLTEVFKRVHPSVVVVQTEHLAPMGEQSGLPASMAGVGSGVLISKDGMVLTASHVVHSADRIVVKFKNEEEIPARVVSSERFADVALLQLERMPKEAVVAHLGDSDQVEVGDQVFVVGAPVGMSYTLTVGHISARRAPQDLTMGFSRVEMFQTDAAINVGNSGGPMFNMEGSVIGIVSHIISKSGGFEGLGFAITMESAKRLLLDQPPFWTGIEGVLLTGPLAAAFNLPQSAGLLVQRVANDSPASRLGLRAGSIVATIDGKPLLIGGDIVLQVQGIPLIGDLSSYTLIRERVGRLRVGDIMTVRVLREGETHELRLPISR
ncbi:MAG: trypsin-like peptidase domain-containing protein [Nitrospirales bacterium]|nr:trypsin-like peptidase domain-containing protein [Nitrospirales bacterium]